MATQCRPRSRRTRHSETAVAAPRPGRTASRPHDPDSPLHDKPRHSCGNPVGERHDPWPARQRSLVGEPPAAASPQPGSAPNWRSQPDHPAGRSSRRRWPVSHRQRRFSPTSPSKPRAHPRSEIRRETTASTPAPPISRQSRDAAANILIFYGDSGIWWRLLHNTEHTHDDGSACWALQANSGGSGPNPSAPGAVTDLLSLAGYGWSWQFVHTQAKPSVTLGREAIDNLSEPDVIRLQLKDAPKKSGL